MTILAALVGWGVGHGAPDAARIVTYEVATRGRTTTDLSRFRWHVQSTLRDPQGWSQGREVVFLEVATNGDFVLWLAEDTELPGFSTACSVDWSCRVGPDVVINERRWNTGAPGWSGDLDSYRHYVVNHEVGHWLGLGHRECTAPGAAAPVMMQQSKSPEPCHNRTWPTDDELKAAMRSLEAR